MNIYFYPADYAGCGHYRVIWPALVADSLGDPTVNVHVVPPTGPEATTFGLYANRDALGKIVDVTHPKDADVIVLQRPSHVLIAESIPILRERYGIAVIVDIDDDLMSIHPSNPAWLLMHPQHQKAGRTDQSWMAVSAACKNATLVTVSTPALTKRYAGDAPTIVVENCIPESFLGVPRMDSQTIGWAGALRSHPNDLDPLGPSIRILGDRGYDFMVVGNGEGAGVKLNLRADPPYTGSIDFEKWISAVSQIGVGLAPLADTKFNAAKSWLKPLEYCVAGVPWIASPRAEYTRFCAMGAGQLANRPRDWEKSISRVLASRDLRDQMSGAGKELAARWTIELHIERWLDAWRTALEFEAKLRTKRATPSGTPSTAPALR